MAEELGLDYTEVLLANFYNDFLGYCHSIIVQQADSNIFHGRTVEADVNIKSAIQDATYVAHFTRGGYTVFIAVMQVGLVGTVTGYRPGQYALAYNTRSMVDIFYNYEEWNPLTFSWVDDYMLAMHLIYFSVGLQENSLGVRQLLEECSSYSCANSYIKDNTTFAGGYFALSDIDSGKVITKYLKQVANTENIGEDDWYLIQENVDHFKNGTQDCLEIYPCQWV